MGNGGLMDNMGVVPNPGNAFSQKTGRKTIYKD
jgi:hypothetical protein